MRHALLTLLLLTLPTAALAQCTAMTRIEQIDGGDQYDTPRAGSDGCLDAVANNFAAAVAPGVDDDVDGGYMVGSFWCDTTADQCYICLDNTDGAAVWDLIVDSLQSAYVGGATIELSAGEGDLVIDNDAGSQMLALDEDTGNVGIGRLTPGAKLDVATTLYVTADGAGGYVYVWAYGGAPFLYTQAANGTEASPTAIVSADSLGRYNVGGYDGTAWSTGAEGNAINNKASENWSVGNHGREITFATVAIGAASATQRMVIDDDGEVYLTTAGALFSAGGEVKSGINGADGKLHIYSEQGGTDYRVTISPHASMTQNTDYTAPPDDGAAGEVLQTDGSGALTWEPRYQVVWAAQGNANGYSRALTTSWVIVGEVCAGSCTGGEELLYQGGVNTYSGHRAQAYITTEGCTTGNTEIRLQDVTNTATLATVVCSASASMCTEDTTFSSVPSADARIQLQWRCSAGTGTSTINSFSWSAY